ncbi:MAG: hypothetical protein DCF15_13810 [Phormidesmis priestleyi]|uniref:Uncharacterized protein n=1 Tax=Phormidesmis priestleyi TaxID=268141 RepID=A0A2W4X5U8_9CYAN|nr:MAG: hypothetical protein DCF15_13810 [Phormidesmis priestleyi]
MSHSFLLESGRWTLQGTWLTRDALPAVVKGKLLVAWKQDNCFVMATKLTFPEAEGADDIVIQSRGRMTTQERQYTFVVQHSLLGQVEGEGWIAPESIVQRYWGVNDKQRRTGFETLRQIGADRYHFSGGVMAGHYLTSTIEAELVRQ